MTEDDDPGEDRPRDRPFNAYRCPRSDKVAAVVADVTRQLQNYEKHDELRQRKRRPADQATFEATVSAIVCDLIHHRLSGQDGRVIITRSNRVLGHASRYRPVAYGKTLPDILDRLASPEMAFVKQEEGYLDYFGPAEAADAKPGNSLDPIKPVPRGTTIAAGERLIARINKQCLTLDDLGTRSGEEIIILKRAKEDHWDEGGKKEYDDTPETRQHRADLTAINAWLASADIDFHYELTDSRPVDTADRRLRRYFTNGSFECGGRLFGGFWQRLKKPQRFEGIFIDDDRVVSLDYGQMAPRIVYGMARCQPPEGDAYDLGDFRMPRAGVKKVFNSLLFSAKPLDRMPKGVRQLFPASVKIGDVVERIEHRHGAIKHLFCTGIGHYEQFIESEILVDVLLELKNREIVGLPVHDAVIVAASAATEARKVMEKVFENHAGVSGLVEEEEG